MPTTTSAAAPARRPRLSTLARAMTEAAEAVSRAVAAHNAAYGDYIDADGRAIMARRNGSSPEAVEATQAAYDEARRAYQQASSALDAARQAQRLAQAAHDAEVARRAQAEARRQARRNPVGADHFTFGIEIECYMPNRNVDFRIGEYSGGSQVDGLPNGWKAKYDGSLSAPSGNTTIELVSPVLRGADGVRQIVQVCAWLRSKGAKVNSTCGFHVHVGFDRENPDHIGRLVALFARHEEAFYAATGSPNRKHSQYARPIKQSSAYRRKYLDKDAAVRIDNRYMALNLISGKPTVEFRVFQGTTNQTKILAYVQLCIGLAQRAVNGRKEVAWDHGGDYQHRKSTGADAVSRLVYQLGWWDTDKVKSFGLLPAVEGAPDVKSMKAELYRLAKKYDANGGADEIDDNESEDDRRSNGCDCDACRGMAEDDEDDEDDGDF